MAARLGERSAVQTRPARQPRQPEADARTRSRWIVRPNGGRSSSFRDCERAIGDAHGHHDCRTASTRAIRGNRHANARSETTLPPPSTHWFARRNSSHHPCAGGSPRGQAPGPNSRPRTALSVGDGPEHSSNDASQRYLERTKSTCMVFRARESVNTDRY